MTGELLRLNIVRLGNDHTSGTRPGAPRAMIAENDVALGRLVEAISNSRFCKESAIFVLEDDAQNGPDHVDSHRSIALVVSPFAKRQALDERNGAGAWGAAASLHMNFEEADMTPEYELNEIIWKSVRGAASPMPPPVRAWFIRIIEDDEDEGKKN